VINFAWVIYEPFCKDFRPYRDIIGHPLFISKKSLTSIVKLHNQKDGKIIVYALKY
jgi:hypothetical protein